MGKVDSAKDGASLYDFVSKDVKLTKDGDRWIGLCPFHSEKTPSFNVFVSRDGSERYHCFGCQARGDVIDYVADTRSVSFDEACAIIKGETDPGASLRRKDAKPGHDPYAGITVVSPVPSSATEPLPGTDVMVWNPKRKSLTKYHPSMVHRYLDAKGRMFGVVLRQEFEDGRKITPQVQWCDVGGKQQWCHYTFAERIYGLDMLANHPTAQVIIVEGEKTADAARKLLNAVVITWAGGSASVGKVDWSPLKGRRIVLIPDADPEGLAAMEKVGTELHKIGCSTKMVDTSGQPRGWDLADADGWDTPQAKAWLKARASDWTPPEPEIVAEPKVEPKAVAPKKAAANKVVDWRLGMMFNEDGNPAAKPQHNVTHMLRFHPDLAGVFIHNDFSIEITVVRCPPWEDPETFVPRRLADSDITFAQAALEQRGLSPSSHTTRAGIVAAASKHSIHPAREYFRSLKWDGVERLSTWLTYYLGVGDSDYSRLVGRKWLVASVKRVMEPGCKFDNMLILEGPQGLRKSMALRELATINGTAYFTDAIKDIDAKEAAMTMQGVLIVEIAELDALSKADITNIKSWITRQVDQYRPPYGFSIYHSPRQCVLAGTVNPERGYLKDPTGARRFWPVACTAIDIDALKRDREQLWAEAVAANAASERVWLEEEEIALAQREQDARYQDDVWGHQIDMYTAGRQFVTMNSIMEEVLHIPTERRDERAERRVGRHLMRRGWVATSEYDGNSGITTQGFEPRRK